MTWTPAGMWTARSGKTVLVEPGAEGRWLVTVAPTPDSPPYETAPLLDGRRRPVRRLPAAEYADGSLQIEAGKPDLGPTYTLKPEPRLDGMVLLPYIGYGLYDDWDDDAGVPWAYPLEEFRRA